MTRKNEDILDWLQKSLRTVAQKKFSTDQDDPVRFDDYADSPTDKWIELYPGCDVMFTDRTDSRFVIHCRMTEGILLPIHHHPDYTEIFTIISGCIFDLVSYDVLTKNTKPRTFLPNVSHAIRCESDCYMTIECLRSI